ncbi:hypothetical protein CTAYLR_003766 [Chrysophaeum taylorii]|uniref:SRP9 domain-containing protein n=1 Tax=Chrysophaeum taylorii TaxID=2483200 RepID=A0AAD7UCV9_9STRA|nr:hypothetical protein CTAYLR_003766 [Chrysophaeum taylorii]
MASRPASIDEFTEKAKELFESDPAKVRFVLKYKHGEGTMTLRTTNDEFWLIYRTDQAAELRRLEALQLWLMAAMCAVSPESLDAPEEEDKDHPRRRRGKKSKK